MKQKTYLILLLILILAVFFRVYPLIGYEGVMGADNYFHGRMIRDFLTTQDFPNEEYAVYGGGDIPQTQAYWSINVILYLAVFGSAFSMDNLLLLMKIMPVVWAILAVFFTFLFVKQLYGKKPALVSAFIMATIPAFTHRTMWGFFEDECIVFFLVSLFLYLLFTKKYALLSLIPLVILASIWSIAYMLLGCLLIAVLIWAYGKEFTWDTIKSKFHYILLFVLSVFLLVSSLSTANVYVAEEEIGITHFFEKFNVLIIFPILALLFISTEKEEKIHNNFIWFLTLFSLILAFYSLKLTFLMGFPIAICAGYIFDRFKNYRKILLLVLGVSLFFSFAYILTEESQVEKYLPAIEHLKTFDECVLFNWWDMGHWITFYTDCEVFADNRIHPFDRVGLYSDFVLGHKDCNDIKDFGFTHMLFLKNLSGVKKLNILMMYSQTQKSATDYSCLELKWEDEHTKIYEINFGGG